MRTWLSGLCVLCALVVSACGGEETSSGGDLGQEGNIDGVLWTFESVNVSGDTYTVKFKVQNPNDDDEKVFGDDVKFIAGNGAEYDPDGGSTEDLQPGSSKEFETEYKVPADADPAEGFIKVGVTAGDDEFVDVGLGSPPATDAQMAKSFHAVATPATLRLGNGREIDDTKNHCLRDDREYNCTVGTTDPNDIVGFEDSELAYRVKLGGNGRWTARLTKKSEFDKGAPATLSGTASVGLDPAE